MSFPDKPVITYSYTGFAAGQGGNLFPGSQMDNDLALLKVASADIIDFLKLFASSEGKILLSAIPAGADFAADIAAAEAAAVAAQSAQTSAASSATQASSSATSAAQTAASFAATIATLAVKGQITPADHANFSGASKLLGSGSAGASPAELSIGGTLTTVGNVLMGGIFTNFAAFTTAGATTWTCPAGVTRAKVTVIGGGAAGGNSGGATGAGGGGGAGGTAIKWFTDLVPDTVYNLTVGAAGAASSFTGPSATPTGNGGGAAGGNAAAARGGAGGTATGGDLNLAGAAGTGGIVVSATGGFGGSGGSGPFGGAGFGTAVAGTGQNNGSAGSAPGAGGGGGVANSGTSGSGGAGAVGAVIIEY